MKKLGLRVLAGGLAALMAVSVLAPAKVASAENDLLQIAPAPLAAPNTLYITADMVDVDNEIIISGEDWDRIVVTKEAAAANIYFDEVEVGELVVESGSSSDIQLWKVDAGKVTVKEPELKEIDMTGLRVLLAEEETRQQAVDYFMRVQAENEKTLRQYPRIITMEDAAVETISAGAGIRLDLHEGDVKALNVEASSKLDRMDVTLEGYNGDVTYVGNAGFSIVNLKNVDSRINKLTVADSAASNYLNVSSKDSVALNVEVAGNAKVALNIPMGELTIAEAAKAAKVDVLNAVDSMNVAADNAQVEIAPIGNIAQASIIGDKVTISGTGVLTEAVILGKDAYVSTKGTDVEGENTYVEPVYAEPKVVVKDVYNNMTAGSTELTENSDGSATIAFSGQYQTATFNVPATVDVDRIRSITVEVTIRAQFGLSIVTKGGEAVVSEYPGYGISEETKKEFTYYINPGEQKIGKIGFMSLNAGQPDMTVNSVTFTLYDEGKAPTAKPTPPPAAPSELNLPAGSKEWQFADMLPCAEGSWGNTVSEAVNNGIKAEYERQYACTKFTLPEALTVGDFEKVIVTASSATGPLGIELYDETNTKIGFWWNKKVTETTDLALTYNTTGYGGGESISAENLTKQVAMVNVMYHGDGEGAEVILYRIAFVAKPGAGGEDTPTPTPGVGDTPTPAPETGTACITDRWAVHTFTAYDLREYAGTTVEISVDMRKTGGDSAAPAHVQLNDSGYTVIAWGQSITDEWTNFSYTWEVPAALADEANPVYFGFRTASDVDYSAYTFFYKDFTFTGTSASGEDTPTPTPEVTETPTPTPVPAYYEENFTADYFAGGSSWDVTKGLANYKLAGLEVISDAAYEGDYCIKVKMNDVYNGITYTLDNIEGEAAATFTFSAYLKATGVAGEQFVRMGVGNTYTNTSYWTATDTWAKVTKEVEVAAGESATIVFSAQDPQYCDAEDEQMASVYIDKVMIEKVE